MASADNRPHDEGGDPVCWLHLACRQCGRLDDDLPQRCRGCGAVLLDLERGPLPEP